MTSVPTAHNLADLVRVAAQRGAAYPALIDVTGGSELSWAQVDAAVNAEAQRLRGAGVSPGDRVAVRLPTGAPFCVAVLGALRAGGVVVPLSTGAPAPELRRVLTDSAASVLVSEDPSDTDTMVIAPPVLDVGPVEPVSAVGGGDDLAVLAYTSGAAGTPRGVMLPHRALLANIAQCAALRPAPVNAADRVLLALPLFHVYGLGPGLLQVAAAGATAVLMERFEPERALTVVERHRVTTIVGVPTMYQDLLRLPAERLRAGLATVRLLTSGAAPLDPSLSRRVRSTTGLDVFEGYGLTETGPVLTSSLVSGRSKPGSVGSPLPGVEVRLVDADGQPLPSVVDGGEDAAGTGLVAARGPNLFSGYWPDGRDGPDADGWFRTEDVGYLDADGDLHLVDRAGDLIIVNGFNVYPHEVENVLVEHPAVAEAAAVGTPDPETGETVKAVVVLRADAVLTEEDVLAHCASQLAKFKVPTIVEFVETLPHTSTGKLARARLRP